MERYSFAMEVKKGQMNLYRKKLGEIWQELVVFLDENNIRNFSIWNCRSLIFGYCETEEKKDLYTAAQEQISPLITQMEHIVTWISTPGQNMRLMYHNFEIGRASCRERV